MMVSILLIATKIRDLYQSQLNYNRKFIDSLVVQTAKHKTILNENDTDPIHSTENPRTVSQSTQHKKNYFRRMDHLPVSVELMKEGKQKRSRILNITDSLLIL